nr:DUF3786 domain-containing protein [Dissulfurirhabdus thermomarina]
MAPVVGARYDEEAGTPWLVLPYLGRRIRVGPAGAAADDGRELDPRDQILLHNYLFFCRTGEVEGRWIGLESLPNSISKVTTLRRAAEERLAGAFAGRPGDLAEAASRLGGTVPPACEADLCIEIPVLPRVPLRLQFWDADPEDGFPARVKVLFDGAVDRVLDLESTVFAAERTAEALLDLDPAESAGRRTS